MQDNQSKNKRPKLTWSVSNFKAFSNIQKIPIKPITLIYGANSSGKSTVIQSLLYLKQAIKIGDFDIRGTDCSGDSVDLGGFVQTIHQHQTNRKLILGLQDTRKLTFGSTSLREGRESVPPVLVDFGIELGIGIDKGLADDDKPRLLEYKIFIDDVLFTQFEQNIEGFFILSACNLSALGITHDSIRLFDDFRVNIDQTISLNEDKIVAADLKHVEYLLLERFAPDMVKVENQRPKAVDLSSFRPGLFPMGDWKEEEGGAYYEDTDVLDDDEVAIRFYVNAINRTLELADRSLSDVFFEIDYLGPLRSYPARDYSTNQHEEPNWFSGGGYAWEAVRDNAEVRAQVNKWIGDPKLQTPYRLEIQETMDSSNIDAFFKAQLSDKTSTGKDHVFTWKQVYNDFKTESSKWSSANHKTLILTDLSSKTKVSHKDIGVGISQVLPVLVSSLGQYRSTIAIEQPEIHLHPALQAELGDIFIDSALGERGNCLILESHSEHMLLRIMKRMRETNQGRLVKGMVPVTPDDISLLFVEKVGSHSVVREMPLNENGELIRAWPGGFFEEDLKEVF